MKLGQGNGTISFHAISLSAILLKVEFLFISFLILKVSEIRKLIIVLYFVVKVYDLGFPEQCTFTSYDT